MFHLDLSYREHVTLECRRVSLSKHNSLASETSNHTCQEKRQLLEQLVIPSSPQNPSLPTLPVSKLGLQVRWHFRILAIFPLHLLPETESGLSVRRHYRLLMTFPFHQSSTSPLAIHKFCFSTTCPSTKLYTSAEQVLEDEGIELCLTVTVLPVLDSGLVPSEASWLPELHHPARGKTFKRRLAGGSFKILGSAPDRVNACSRLDGQVHSSSDKISGGRPQKVSIGI